MKKIVTLLMLITALTTLACRVSIGADGIGDLVVGQGDVLAETRSVDDFDSLRLDGSGDVIIEQGETSSLEVEAYENLLPYITSEVRSGTLVLGFKPGVSITTSRPIIFRVGVEDLARVEIDGSGDIDASSLEGNSLDIRIDGSGDVTFGELSADEIKVRIAGSGTVDVSGQVDAQGIDIPGSGNYQADELHSQTVDIRIDGSGNARLWVDEDLEARISGSGDIAYYGNPQTDVRITGSGDIRELGEHP